MCASNVHSTLSLSVCIYLTLQFTSTRPRSPSPFPQACIVFPLLMSFDCLVSNCCTFVVAIKQTTSNLAVRVKCESAAEHDIQSQPIRCLFNVQVLGQLQI